VAICHEIGQGVLLDNGAYSAWSNDYAPNWADYYRWVEPWLDYATTWAVIPDVIDGDEDANDMLVAEWPHGDRGAPVWHLHESIERLLRLAADWPRVCLGSSGQYAEVGSPRWHVRMIEAMNALCGDGPPPVWLHMLRGLALAGSHYPFASADSANVGRNYNGVPARGGIRRDVRVMVDEIDGRQCPARWTRRGEQLELSEKVAV
jgi:hypothetical protein